MQQFSKLYSLYSWAIFNKTNKKIRDRERLVFFFFFFYDIALGMCPKLVRLKLKLS